MAQSNERGVCVAIARLDMNSAISYRDASSAAAMGGVLDCSGPGHSIRKEGKQTHPSRVCRSRPRSGVLGSPSRR